MKNKFTLNESERERILNLHEQQKPGIINRVKGAIQGFKNPTQQPAATTTTPPVAATTTPPVAATTTPPVASTTTPPVASTTTPPAANTSWVTSADNSTICQTKPSKTMVPQLKQIQAAINKWSGSKPESKTIKGCSGNLLFPLKEDGLYGANTAKAILIAVNYQKMSGGKPAATTTPVAATTTPPVAATTTPPVAATTTPPVAATTAATPGEVKGNTLAL